MVDIGGGDGTLLIWLSFHDAGLGMPADSLQDVGDFADQHMRHQERQSRASFDGNSIVVRFIDTGPGVANPEQLFEPFQPGAQASGLGLYLSRTFVRAFQGDVQYEPQPEGCCFAVILALASDHQAGTVEST